MVFGLCGVNMSQFNQLPRNPLPPINNMGGKFNKLTSIDWLSFTLPSASITGTPSPETAFNYYIQPLLGFLGWSFEMREGGRNFYTYSADILDQYSRVVGFLGFGGNRGTLLVTMTGIGTSQISPAGFSQIAEFCRSHYAKITRLDICFDFDGGDFFETRDQIIDDIDTGGRLPSLRTIDDHGSGEGKTFYVGKRVNGKMFRLYEKGKQLGDKSSRWLRAEVELGCKSRTIPYDALVQPDSYFTGAYSFCAQFVAVYPSKIKTIQKTKTRIACDVLVHYAKTAYGKLINVLQGVYTPEQIVLLLSRDGIPARLYST